jgi:hypothetical protein
MVSTLVLQNVKFRSILPGSSNGCGYKCSKHSINVGRRESNTEKRSQKHRMASDSINQPNSYCTETFSVPEFPEFCGQPSRTAEYTSLAVGFGGDLPLTDFSQSLGAEWNS